MKGTTYIILLLAGALLGGCREAYDPEIEKYENLLVIDGLITDQAGEASVRLSRSYAFNESYSEPEEQAVVMILDESENTQVLEEDTPGFYRARSGFSGRIGESYKLVVSTADGENYESEWVLLKAVPEIDRLSHVFEEREGTDPDQLSYGFQLLVSTQDPSNHTRYYRWEWTETWEFLTPLKSPIYLDEERCWRSGGTSSISIGTTEHLSQDVLVDYPVHFVSNQSNRLKIRYSIELRQYSLSREAYSYWLNLQDTNEKTGSLFDPTPSMVLGNLSNMEEGGKPALGLFQASAVSRKRIFIDQEEVPGYVDIPSGFESCLFYETADSAEIQYYFDNNFAFAGTYTYMDLEYYIFSNSEACFRCSLTGSTEMPPFWEEKPAPLP